MAIPVTLTANETYDERNSTVTITSGKLKRTVVVTQKQLDALLVSSSKIEIPTTGGDFSVEVASNIDYTYYIPDQFASWLSAGAGSRAMVKKEISFKAKPNDEASQREGYILFSGNGIEEKVNVYQAGGETLIISEKSKNISAAGGTIAVEINSNCEFTVAPISVSWIHQDMSRAMSSHTLHFIVDPYDSTDAPRKGEIIFISADGSSSETVTVTQYEKSALVLAESILEIPADGAAVKVEFSSNRNVLYDIPASETSWIKAYDGPPSRAMTKHEQWFEIRPNTDMRPRSANVRFYVEDDPAIEETVTFRQGKYEFEIISPHETISFRDAYSHTINISVASNINYSVELPDNITDVTPSDSPKGAHAFFIAANHDTEPDIRSSDIRFVFKDLTLGSIRISQISADAVLRQEEVRMPADGGCTAIPVETNTDITVGIPAHAKGWIEVMPRKESELVPKIKVAPNVDTTERSAQITVTAGTFFYGEFLLTQSGTMPAPELNITSPEPGHLLEKLGTEPFGITSIAIDGEIDASDMETLKSLTVSGELRTIDLYNVTIRAGEGKYTALGQHFTIKEDNTIGDYMLQSAKMQHMVLPKNIRKIGDYAFLNSGLTEIDIPEGVCEIGKSAFKDNRHLTSVVIPSSLDSIPSSAFESCLALSNVEIKDGVTAIGAMAFGYSNATYTKPAGALSTIKLPKTLQRLSQSAFLGSSIEEIELPENLSYIGESVFARCLNLRKVVMKKAPADGRISDKAFFNDTRLTELSLPEGVSTLGNSSLAYIAVADLKLPSTLKVIEAYALNQAECLTVELPEGLHTIGKGAMSQMPWLKSLDLPSTLTDIGPRAFYSSYYSIKEIHCRMTTPPAVSADIFSPELSRKTPLYVPQGCSQSYRDAPVWGEFTNIIEE